MGLAWRLRRCRHATTQQWGARLMGSGNTIVSIRFQDDMLDVVDRFARKTGRDRADIIRQAVGHLFKDGMQAAEVQLTADLWDDDEIETEKLEVIAMKETLPSHGGRQLIIYSPHRKKPNAAEVKAAIKDFLEAQEARPSRAGTQKGSRHANA